MNSNLQTPGFTIPTIAREYANKQQSATVSSVKDSITATLKRYEKALNTDSTETAVSCYHSSDAIAMFQHFPTAQGTEAITNLYNNTWKAIQLRVQFTIIEIVEGSSEWAWARTSSTGEQTNKSTGGKSQEGNQELFVFRKDEQNGGEWRIARYCFCTVNPPH